MSAFEVEKDKIIREFFDVGSNPDMEVRVTSIKEHKEQLINLLTKQDDIEIRYLINVIDALLIWMLEDNKEKARKEVEHIWTMFKSNYKFSLYDIRILTCILPTASSLEDFVTYTQKALSMLEEYCDHEKYLTLKILLNNNLSYILMKSKYVDKSYNSYLDDLLLDTVNELINLTMDFDNDIFPRAIIRKGVITHDKTLIYAGLKLINNDSSKERIEYIKDNNIFFITYKNLL